MFIAVLFMFLLRVSPSKQASAKQHTQKPITLHLKEKNTEMDKTLWCECFYLFLNKNTPPIQLSIFLLRTSLSKSASAQEHTQKFYTITHTRKEPTTRKWIKHSGGSVFTFFFQQKTSPPRRFINFPPSHTQSPIQE